MKQCGEWLLYGEGVVNFWPRAPVQGRYFSSIEAKFTLPSSGRPLIAGFEATECPHRRLVHRVLEVRFRCRVLYSVALVRTREALHSGPNKNNPMDARSACTGSKLAQRQSTIYHPYGRQRHPGSI